MKVKIKEKEFGDPGKVMLVLHSAAHSNLAIPEDQIDSYIYLLREDDVLRFAYPFRFQPLPYSPMLHDDLYDLFQMRLINRGSSLFITDQGKDWVNKILLVPEREKVLSEIGIYLKEYATWSPKQLFQSVYTRVAKPVAQRR